MYKYLLSAAVALGTVVGTSGIAHAQAKKPPAPGSISVHLNGRVDVQLNDINTSLNSYGGYKLNPIGMSGFFRMYPGFDGTTQSGLQYGAAAEFRTAFTPAGVGMKEGSSSSSSFTAESFTVRRAYVYFGTPQYGFLQAGQTFSPWVVLATGEYYNWGDHNNWNSDGGVGSAVPGATHPQALFTATGALYTTDKLVYLSPKIAGFEAGVSWEPNSNAFKEGYLCSTTDMSNCATVNSGPLGSGSSSRRQNTVVAAIKYSGNFGDFGTVLSAAYLTGSPALEHSTMGDYRNLSVGMLSGQITYAGFLFGANVKFGQTNVGYHFLLPGARNVLFYNLTAEYKTGPYTLAVNYFNSQQAGNWTPGGTVARTESGYGIGVGGDYDLAKGVVLYAMYLYGHNHQLGWDFAAGAAGTANNNTSVNAFTVGTNVTW